MPMTIIIQLLFLNDEKYINGNNMIIINTASKSDARNKIYSVILPPI